MSDMPESPTRRAPQFRGSTVVAEPRLARATSVGSPLGYLQPSRQPTAEASVDEAVVQVVTWSSLPACVGQVESVLFGEDSEMTRSRGFTAATTKLVSAERRQAFETFAARNRLLVFSLRCSPRPLFTRCHPLVRAPPHGGCHKRRGWLRAEQGGVEAVGAGWNGGKRDGNGPPRPRHCA